ncbi:MAG: ATP-binding protein [Sedimenticola sp.]
MLSSLLQRLRSCPDREHQQALMRLLVVVSFTLYLFLLTDLKHPGEEALTLSLWLVGGYFIFTCLYLSHLLIDPRKSIPRRIIGVSVDIVMLTLALLLNGELTSPWYIFYFWIILGNSFRYGERFLWYSATLSIAGFATVIAYTPFWQDHLILAYGLLAGLLLVPVYIVAMARQISLERERAEKSSRAKSEFISRMTHEIRTPLSGIISLAELLQTPEHKRQERDIGEAISASGNRLMDIAEDILEISNLEKGALPVEQLPFDLHETINRTAGMMSGSASEKRLSLLVLIDPQIPFRLIGDPLHLQQVLIHLLDNAIRFTKQGGVTIHCRHLMEEEGCEWFRVEVQDTGIGIPAHLQQAIFEQFTQAFEGTARRFEGAGLGITIAKQLLELMGGRIGLESTPDHGSTFWFELGFQRQEEMIEEQDMIDIRLCRVLRLVPTDSGVTDISHTLTGWGVPFVDAHDLEAVEHQLSDAKSTQGVDSVIVDDYPLDQQVLEGLSNVQQRSGIPIIITGSDVGEAGDKRYSLQYLQMPLKRPHLFNALHARLPGPGERAGEAALETDDETGSRLDPGVKVLVAEDNPINSFIIGKILDRTGIEYTLVDNGQETLDALERYEYDLVILDMQMPVMDGLETFNRYRLSRSEEERIPFIMLTANATLEARRACDEAGISRFLTKPISETKLVEAIAEMTVKGTRPAVTQAVDSDPELPLLDLFIVKQLQELAPNRAFLITLAKQFDTETVMMLGKMKTAHERGDTDTFTRLAHAIKGSAANFGLQHLHKLANEIEILPHETIVSEGDDYLRALHGHFESGRAALLKALELKPGEIT